MTEEDLRLKVLDIICDEGEITVGTDLHQLTTKIASTAIEHFRTIHSRALACHCECLGMNAENMWAAIANRSPVYASAHYTELLQKWGLINKEGEPAI